MNEPIMQPDMISSDELILKQLIDALELITLASPHQMFGLKNRESEMIYYSKSYADFLGIEPSAILGKTTYSLLYDTPDIEAIILNEDNSVTAGRKPVRFLKINRINGNLKPYVCIKSPLANPATGNIIGILLQGLEISALNLNHEIIRSYLQFSNSTEVNQQQLPYLTRRERQVIFFFMNQLTSQEIADIIYKIEGKKVSKSTIDSLFNDQLYIKFKVNSRVALFEKLQQLGYDKLIPSEVLSSTSTPLNIIHTF